ncbi:MAG: maleylpyruvate isomerase family mycothiol-dependent enzyme [Actinomycetota bacterium]
MPPVDTMSYEAKPLMLDVIRTERDRFYGLVEDPANWTVQTRCTEWETRDLVGHMIDVTETYLERWDLARQGRPESDVHGLPAMQDRAADRAIAFRSLPREEALARLHKASDELMGIYDAITPDEWSNFMVTHPYMGPLPSFIYFAFQIMDYGVHPYDIEYGLGNKLARIDERAAGVLIPYMFALMQNTVDPASAEGLDVTYGIEVSGEWGGRWRVTVRDGAFSAQPEEGKFEGCAAVFRFDAPDFVLTSFLRYPGGAASGDPEVIDRVRRLFFAI